ncbi:MAG: phosphate ABC transporter permease PstA [Fimbriimonadaceae bacterium]|nr:phosphate ABC transporter permease PstA [Fimbriimonadaceae bacterium]QYK57888.1 MAG: phosphate ABC transporter permease PstA [Fimbriimonadaceae bacterium]
MALSIQTSPLARRRKAADKAFRVVCLLSVVASCVVLVYLLFSILQDGLPRLNPEFFQNFSSRRPEAAGIKAAMMGSIWIILITAAIAVPVGIAAAVYIEEFSPKNNPLTSFIQVNINNLAGVPSIIYGLLGLAVFVRFFAMDRSIIAGALTLSLLVLPTIIVVAQESIRAVPDSYRHGALALGSTKWQMVRTQSLPNAMSGIVTGVILSLSRAIGETAPLITIGAVAFIATVPENLSSKFTVLPIQIFDWSSRPQSGFHQAAAAAIIVLLAILITLNLVAVLIRARSQKRA